MKHTYGGVTIALPGVVWLFDTEAAVPVYHRGGKITQGGQVVTMCGRLIFDGGAVYGTSYLPPKHAVRIARPCTVCWPALRRQTALFPRSRNPRPNHRQECLV